MRSRVKRVVIFGIVRDLYEFRNTGAKRRRKIHIFSIIYTNEPASAKRRRKNCVFPVIHTYFQHGCKGPTNFFQDFSLIRVS